MSWWEWLLVIGALLLVQNYIDELRGKISVLTNRVDMLEQQLSRLRSPDPYDYDE